MTDLELILRFFALRDYEKMDMRFQDYLGDFMQQRNKQYATNQNLKDSDKTAFRQAVENSWRIFGEAAFKKPGAKHKSAPLADAIMIALSTVEPDSMDGRVAQAIRSGFERLCEADREFQNSIGKGTNGKGAITIRVTRTARLVQDALANR